MDIAEKNEPWPRLEKFAVTDGPPFPLTTAWLENPEVPQRWRPIVHSAEFTVGEPQVFADLEEV